MKAHFGFSAVSVFSFSGGMGIRTPGLVIANDALYQLSYTPDAGDILTALVDVSTTLLKQLCRSRVVTHSQSIVGLAAASPWLRDSVVGTPALQFS